MKSNIFAGICLMIVFAYVSYLTNSMWIYAGGLFVGFLMGLEIK